MKGRAYFPGITGGVTYDGGTERDHEEGIWTLIVAADGTEVEAFGHVNATTAAFALFCDGHPRPIKILPDGKLPLGSYGQIG